MNETHVLNIFISIPSGESRGGLLFVTTFHFVAATKSTLLVTGGFSSKRHNEIKRRNAHVCAVGFFIPSAHTLTNTEIANYPPLCVCVCVCIQIDVSTMTNTRSTCVSAWREKLSGTLTWMVKCKIRKCISIRAVGSMAN